MEDAPNTFDTRMWKLKKEKCTWMSPVLECSCARLGSCIVWFEQFVEDVVSINPRLMEEATTNGCGNPSRGLKWGWLHSMQPPPGELHCRESPQMNIILCLCYLEILNIFIVTLMPYGEDYNNGMHRACKFNSHVIFWLKCHASPCVLHDSPSLLLPPSGV